MKMPRWMRWHCPLDTGFEIRTLAVWGRARYLSFKEAPHNIESSRVSRESTICFFETWMPEWGSNPWSPTFQTCSFNHCTRAPAPLWLGAWRKVMVRPVTHQNRATVFRKVHPFIAIFHIIIEKRSCLPKTAEYSWRVTDFTHVFQIRTYKIDLGGRLTSPLWFVGYAISPLFSVFSFYTSTYQLLDLRYVIINSNLDSSRICPFDRDDKGEVEGEGAAEILIEWAIGWLIGWMNKEMGF